MAASDQYLDMKCQYFIAGRAVYGKQARDEWLTHIKHSKINRPITRRRVPPVFVDLYT